MSIEEISSSDPAPRNVAAPTPAGMEVSKSTASITRDIVDALAEDIQQFKGISFSDPAPGRVAAPAWAWREGKDVVWSIKRRFGYVMSSKSYAQDLEKEVQNLAYETERVNKAVEEAMNNVRNVYSYVTEWQASAEKALKEARDLLGEFQELSKTCCHGTLPDANCRYQFSRKAEGKIKVIKQLAQKCSGFKELNDISFSDPAPGNVTAPNPARREREDVIQSTTARASASSASTSNELSEDGVFESRAAIIRDIMGALADHSNSVVGVYGMGGVGKSTLLDNVVSRIREEKRFDLVAKADVSQYPDIKRIQSEIAHALGLDMKDYEYESIRADRLRESLGNEEKEVLIILDSLWEGLDLKSVGIPCRHDNKVIGCKLLLTSRDRNVLQMQMRCDKVFLLNMLEEKEAKILFERMVGDKVHTDEFRPMVNEALRKCAGLPLLIVTMAKHFRCGRSREWRNALNQIELSTNEGLSAMINMMLQLSYDHLEREQAKSLLQLFACGASNPSVENLVRYGYGLGIFQKDRSMEDAREEVSTLIHTLQASSLLLDNGGANAFKIHDLVRDFVAQFVFKYRPLLMLKDKDVSATQLQNERLKSCSAICFPYIDLKELPKELDCPELRIFLLFNNNESLEVPDSYFNSMKKLAVLNLTSVCLTRSPTPFELLKNLHTLSLHNCSLDDVAIVGKLKGLQILSFMNSKIELLPKEIGQLVELRLLDLNHCSCLQIIEPGVLGRLIKLEELYMENSFNQWNAVEQTQPTNVSLIELNHMKNLCTLYVCIPDSTVLPKDLNVKKLTKYGIQIGGRCWLSRKGPRTLELQLNPKRDILWKGFIQTALDRVDALYMDELNGIKQSLCELSPKGFPNLKHLHVENSPSVHYILWQRSLPAFRMLELLCLKNLINLEKICHTHVYSKSFSTLKVVIVESCDKMEVLFPLSLVRELPQLEEIRVIHCNLLREIVKADDRGKVELHNLQVLELRDLPNIKNFSIPGMDLLSSTSNNQVSTQVVFFSGQQVSISSLESLTMVGLPNLKYLWSDEFQLRLSNLQSLQISGCKSLSNVINSMSLVKLHKLQTFTIEDCDLVKEIFDLDGPSTSENVETLSELTTFSLARLPSLRRIWNMNPCGIVQFHDLKKLEVSKCENLRFMFFSSMGKSLAKLRVLRVWDCKRMESIIAEEEGLGVETSKTLAFAFPMLTDLQLGYLESLTCFSHKECSREARSQDRVNSSLSVLFNQEVVLPSLETLNITSMHNFQMIWDNQGYFQHLKTLDVSHCHQLTYVFTSTIARNLVALGKLRISNCKMLIEVFSDDGSKEGHAVAFNQLKFMELDRLTGLRSFSSGGYTLMFPLLEDVIVTRCLNMKVFSKGPMEAPKLEKVQVSIEAWFWEGNLNMTIQKMYEEMATVDGVEFIRLSKFPQLIGKWHDEPIPIKPFSKLESLVMDKCPSFINAIPSMLMLALHNTRILQVRDCELLEEIFDLKGLKGVESTQVLPQLWHLALVNLPKLRWLWNKDIQGRLRFNFLSHLTVYKCSNLRHTFAPSMVQCLATLKYIELKDCGQMEGVIAQEEEYGSAAKKITFPYLCWMELEYLPNLTSFLLGKNHTLECPQLKWLTIAHCPIMRSFNGQSLMEIDHGIPSLFTPQVAFPSLEILHITSLNNIEMTWENQVATKSFPNLKSLCIRECNKLRCIWDKELHHQVIFQCLRCIRVFRCQSLTSLCPTSVAINLTQLEELEIDGCGTVGLIEMEEGLVPTFVFPKLTFLRLEDLIDLKCIYTGTHALHWLALKTLEVHGCNKVEILASQPKNEMPLHKQPLFLMEKDGFPSLETLRITYMDNIKMIWNNFQHLKTLDVSHCNGVSYMFTSTIAEYLVELIELRISDCKMLTEVIRDEGGKKGHEGTSNEWKNMKLDWLTRLKCFTQKEGQGSTMEIIRFPNLLRVELECLPNLKSFLSGNDHTLEWPILEELTIANCPNMTRIGMLFPRPPSFLCHLCTDIQNI